MGTAPATSLALAELALLALGRGDVDTAVSHSWGARDLIETVHLQGYATSVLPYAVASRVALAEGDHLRARRFAQEAAEGRTMLTIASPALALQARIQLAWSALGLFEVDDAQVYLAESADLVRDCGDMGSLAADLEEAGEQLNMLRLRPGAPPLSPAEARLLPLLATQLSFQEIGERLHISRNTVKTEVISIYRKLGVTSRSAAVDTSRDLGLLA